SSTAYAAAPGITGPSFDLTAQAAFISQPDGQMIYSCGDGCNTTPSGFNPSAAKTPGATCPSMQIPEPTLIVNEGYHINVASHNTLTDAAGNTSNLIPGFKVAQSNGVAGVCAQETP